MEPCTTVAVTERTTKQTKSCHELELRHSRIGVDIATNTIQQDEKSIVPSDALQKFDNDENEQRKRRHKFGINPELLRWLWEYPTRIPKAREDMARWTKYMAKEMSNPAFQLFLSMAYNFKTP